MDFLYGTCCLLLFSCFLKSLIVVDGSLKKVKYAIRIEFQVCGSPDGYSFLWVIDAPILSECNMDEYISFVGNIIKASLRDIEVNLDLFHLGLTYQIHSHPKPYGK